MNVDRAFREWCAVLGCAPNGVGGASYRLVRRADGCVQVEQALPDGSVERLATPMSEAAFCDAVGLVTATFRVKTTLVARAVAKRMRKGRARSSRA